MKNIFFITAANIKQNSYDMLDAKEEAYNFVNTSNTEWMIIYKTFYIIYLLLKRMCGFGFNLFLNQYFV